MDIPTPNTKQFVSAKALHGYLSVTLKGKIYKYVYPQWKQARRIGKTKEDYNIMAKKVSLQMRDEVKKMSLSDEHLLLSDRHFTFVRNLNLMPSVDYVISPRNLHTLGNFMKVCEDKVRAFSKSTNTNAMVPCSGGMNNFNNMPHNNQFMSPPPNVPFNNNFQSPYPPNYPFPNYPNMNHHPHNIMNHGPCGYNNPYPPYYGNQCNFPTNSYYNGYDNNSYQSPPPHPNYPSSQAFPNSNVPHNSSNSNEPPNASHNVINTAESNIFTIDTNDFRDTEFSESSGSESPDGNHSSVGKISVGNKYVKDMNVDVNVSHDVTESSMSTSTTVKSSHKNEEKRKIWIDLK